MELKTPVWVMDTKRDRIWVKVIEWYDLKEELGIMHLEPAQRKGYSDKIQYILSKGSGTFDNRYRITVINPRSALHREHSGGILLRRLVKHGLGRMYA